MEGVKLVEWGYEIKTSSDDCISAINGYYHQVLSCGRKRRLILEAPFHDPICVLGNILAAHFLFSADPCRAQVYLDAAKSRLDQATAYEEAVFDSIQYLASPNRDDDVAVELHSQLLQKFPKDLMSLKRAQLLCFYVGRADLSYNLVQQVISENQNESYIYGMLAFPLLELGQMDAAEKAAKKGVEINKEDSWSHHCLCHVYQFECRFEDAVEFMVTSSPAWSECTSFMLTHNWWHVALCLLEGHSSLKNVLEVYDNHIWKELERPDAVHAEVYLNALALLLRVYVRCGMNIFEDRLKTIAGCLTDESTWFLEWHLDVLTVWALAKTGECVKAENLLEGLRSRIATMRNKKQQMMLRGLKLAEALYEYGRDNYEQAFELLGPDFDASSCKIIGASDEQVDVFNEVWFDVLLYTGQPTKAVKAIEEGIKKRQGVPFLWRLLEKGYSMASRHGAIAAGQKACALESAYFKQQP